MPTPAFARGRRFVGMTGLGRLRVSVKGRWYYVIHVAIKGLSFGEVVLQGRDEVFGECPGQLVLALAC